MSSSETQPDAVDIHIGAAIRTRRLERKMSQETLAQAAAVSFPQIQKYEAGRNRVSGSRLQAIARALGCHPGELFPAEGPPADIGVKTWLDAARVLNTRRPGLIHKLADAPREILMAIDVMASHAHPGPVAIATDGLVEALSDAA